MDTNKNPKLGWIIPIVIFSFFTGTFGLLIFGYIIYSSIKSSNKKSDNLNGNIGKVKKPNSGTYTTHVSSEDVYRTKPKPLPTLLNDYITEEIPVKEVYSSDYSRSGWTNVDNDWNKPHATVFTEYANTRRGMNPEELLELIHGFTSEYTHQIYHEASGTAHINSGVCIIHNDTKNKWYVTSSSSLLKRVEKYFNGQIRNEIYYAYKAGDSIWIKLLPLKGSPYQSLYEMEIAALSTYDAKRI